MSMKKKFDNAKAKTLQLLDERPLETIIVASMAVTATAKLIHSVTEARNSGTWQREVKRREQNQNRQA